MADDLPENEYREYFGPDYKLHSTAKHTDIDNLNSPQYLESLKIQLLQNIARSARFCNLDVNRPLILACLWTLHLQESIDNSRRYLVYLKHGTPSLRPTTVYPKVLYLQSQGFGQERMIPCPLYITWDVLNTRSLAVFQA